jgi:hypothetical protein
MKSDPEAKICKTNGLWDPINKGLKGRMKPSASRSDIHVTFDIGVFISKGFISMMSTRLVSTKVYV